MKIYSFDFLNLSEHFAQNHYSIPRTRLSPDAWSLKSDQETGAFAKITKEGKPLGKYLEGRMFYGLKTGLNEAFEIGSSQRLELIQSAPNCRTLIKKFLGGQNIRRYDIEGEDRYLIVIPNGWTRNQIVKSTKGITILSEREAFSWFQGQHPGLAQHIAQFADALKKRQDKGEYWWELRPCDYYAYLDAPKIIFPDICKSPRFYLDQEGIYISNTAYCLGTDDRYLLGILNSRLFGSIRISPQQIVRTFEEL